MKKTRFFAYLLVIVMCVGLFGCATAEEGSSSVSESSQASEESKVFENSETSETSETSSVSEDSSELASEDASKGEESEVSTEKDPTVIRVGGLKGPTSMGMVKLMEDNANGTALNNYEFTIEAAADSLSPLILQGKLDIAAVPTNLASVLYNKTEGKIKLLAVNTLGVLYIVNRGDALSVADLKGKTLYATGKSAVPEYALRYVLAQNGIDPDKDITIEWKSQPDEVVAILSADENTIAMLPQPYVTVASTKVEGLNASIDLTKEWDNLGTDSRLITGTLAVRAEFAEAHPDLVANFLSEYKASTEFVNANVDEASLLVEKFDIVKAAVAKKAIPYCNIVFISGEEMKSPVEGYLKTVFDQNPTAVGGALPDESFYYSK